MRRYPTAETMLIEKTMSVSGRVGSLSLTTGCSGLGAGFDYSAATQGLFFSRERTTIKYMSTLKISSHHRSPLYWRSNRSSIVTVAEVSYER